MGFWDRLFGKDKQSDNQHNPDRTYDDKCNPDMACELTLCGEKYLLSEFDLQYDRQDSDKGCFEMCARIEERVHHAIENWIASSARKESGCIRFYRNTEMAAEGALFEIRFKEAGCIRFRKHLQDSHPATTLVLTIPSLCMAEEEFEMQL